MNISSAGKLNLTDIQKIIDNSLKNTDQTANSTFTIPDQETQPSTPNKISQTDLKQLMLMLQAQTMDLGSFLRSSDSDKESGSVFDILQSIGGISKQDGTNDLASLLFGDSSKADDSSNLMQILGADSDEADNGGDSDISQSLMDKFYQSYLKSLTSMPIK
ncbi:MAG: hypothetical protein ACM3PP_04940 [Candidatus Saccharibacteria bacterium]